jgi:hypothetical protein
LHNCGTTVIAATQPQSKISQSVCAGGLTGPFSTQGNGFKLLKHTQVEAVEFQTRALRLRNLYISLLPCDTSPSHGRCFV